jgi:hypothetical protein
MITGEPPFSLLRLSLRCHWLHSQRTVALSFADASYKKALYPTKRLNPPPTPTFDLLAGAGVKLESYYVNKLCSPVSAETFSIFASSAVALCA